LRKEVNDGKKDTGISGRGTDPQHRLLVETANNVIQIDLQKGNETTSARGIKREKRKTSVRGPL